MVNQYIDSQGIHVRPGVGAGENVRNDSALSTITTIKEVCATLEWNDEVNALVPGFNAITSNSDDTLSKIRFGVAAIPANANIKEVLVVVSEDFVLGANTIDVGLYDEDGTEIDADGLVAAAAEADLAVGILEGAGALVGENIGSDAGYIVAAVSAGSDFAGKAKIIVRYI